MVETIAPSQMQANIGLLRKQLFRIKRGIENIGANPLRTPISPLRIKIQSVYARTHITQ